MTAIVRNKFILLFLGLIISIIFIELMLRAYKWHTYVSVNEWTYTGTVYSPEYIYWEKPYCKKNPNDCNMFEERILNYPIERYPQRHDTDCNNPMTILFLGDSFTDAPWTPSGMTYASVFSRKYAEITGLCTQAYRLSTGGSGTDQQYKKALDTLSVLHPNILIWQFYYNDLDDVTMNPIYDVEADTLIARNTWLNRFFWAGFLNQNIPLYRSSAIGHAITFLLERYDVFRNSPSRKDYQYSTEKIKFLIKSLGEITQSKGISMYTTLAPLECVQIRSMKCEYGEDIMNTQLETLLSKHSHYIPMTLVYPDTKDASSPLLFNSIDDQGISGQRHLSTLGNMVYGEFLFENFIQESSPSSLHASDVIE